MENFELALVIGPGALTVLALLLFKWNRVRKAQSALLPDNPTNGTEPDQPRDEARWRKAYMRP